MSVRFARCMKQRGMSLIEILIVLGLVASLTAFILTRVMGASERAKFGVTDTKAMALHEKMMSFRSDMKRYPESVEGLEALTTRPEKDGGLWRGPYISDGDKESLLDGWDQPFEYELTPKGPKLRSQGPKPEDTSDDLMYLNGQKAGE